MPSFDIMSEPEIHEVQNAFDQSVREIAQRFDFRGTDSELLRTEQGFDLISNSEDRATAIWDVLKDKFVKRKISLKYLEKKDALPIGGSRFKIVVTIKKGIDKDHAKTLVNMIKGEKQLKVTATIQGDAVRITGKKKDELQEVMAVLRTKDFPLELTFGNFRD